MLAESPSIGYIHEPFNMNPRARARCDAKFRYWFTYISEENEELYLEPLERTLNFHYNLAEGYKASKSLKQFLNHVKQYFISASARFNNLRPLMKDPIALFSSEWLASKFNMDVVVLIRHPAAFAGSVKNKNWGINFSQFLDQKLLMDDHLYPFEDEIIEHAEKRHDIIDQAILFWKMAYYMIDKYRERHRDWIFIRHEDLSRDPLSGYKKIFNKLNLRYTNSIEETIRKHSYADHAENAQPNNHNSIRRNSLSTIWNWKERLTREEINRIKNNVEEISSLFYTHEEW